MKRLQIYFDPSDKTTVIEEDKQIIKEYQLFENLVKESSSSPGSSDECKKSKWVIRIVMDSEKMFSKNITMDDVYFAINNTYREKVSCVYSDYNSDNLVFRIRLLKPNKNNKAQNNVIDVSDEIYMLKTFQEELLKKIICLLYTSDAADE